MKNYQLAIALLVIVVGAVYIARQSETISVNDQVRWADDRYILEQVQQLTRIVNNQTRLIGTQAEKIDQLVAERADMVIHTDLLDIERQVDALQLHVVDSSKVRWLEEQVAILTTALKVHGIVPKDTDTARAFMRAGRDYGSLLARQSNFEARLANPRKWETVALPQLPDME